MYAGLYFFAVEPGMDGSATVGSVCASPDTSPASDAGTVIAGSEGRDEPVWSWRENGTVGRLGTSLAIISRAGLGKVLYVEPSEVYLEEMVRWVCVYRTRATHPWSYNSQYSTPSVRRYVHTAPYDQSIIGFTRSNAGQP